jgi:hypothetical protein
VVASPTSNVDSNNPLRKNGKWSKQDLAIERLTQSNKEVYLEAARVFKKMEEKKECTFKPRVNDETRRYEDVQVLFDRLHDDRERRQQNMKFREEQKKRLEVQNCTFTPKTVIPKDPTLRKARNNDQ